MKKCVKIIVVLFVLGVFIDFFRFPECYMTTGKYQLRNDIYAGNESAIQLYENCYVKHNRDLFDDDFAIREVYMKGEER